MQSHIRLKTWMFVSSRRMTHESMVKEYLFLTPPRIGVPIVVIAHGGQVGSTIPLQNQVGHHNKTNVGGEDLDLTYMVPALR